MRMTPTAVTLMPLTWASTAQVRIAPKAIRIKLATMPICVPPYPEGGLREHNARATRSVAVELVVPGRGGPRGHRGARAAELDHARLRLLALAERVPEHDRESEPEQAG